MRLWSRLRLWLRATLQRSRIESEMNAELHFHIEAYTEDLMRGGLSRGEAMRRARLDFGGAEGVKEECRAARGTQFLDTLAQDLRYAVRTLRRSPGFASVAVLTLALGIGANTAIFSVVNGVLLKPLPYPDPEQLVSVELSPLALNPSLRGMAPEDYFVFRDQSRTFQDIGLYAETDADRDVNVTGFAEPERVHALDVTDGVLSTLGVPPLLGRIFSRADDSPGAPLTAIVTYGYWQRRFGADPAVIGKAIVVDGEAREIIGVLPRNFRFLDQQDLSLILPLQLDRNKTYLGDFSYFGIGRLSSGSTLADANADVARMLPIALDSFPVPPGLSSDFLEKARLAPSLVPLKQDIVGDLGTVLWVLMGSIGLVLLIACANVANLLLVRTEGRQHELALRAALGASRRRVAVQLLRENAILGLLGGIFGLGLAYAALRVLVRFAPPGLPRISDIGIDPPVLLFALLLAIFASLLSGLIPVVKHAGLRAGLAENGRTASQSRERHRAHDLLVALQVALALVLLICSGLMIRTFGILTRVDPGFAGPSELQTFRISIAHSDVPDAANVPRMEQEIVDKLAAIPGVPSAAFASAVPMDGDNRLDNVFAADRVYAQGALPPLRHLLFVSPGYFRTLGIPVIAGRDLTWTDTYNRVPVALISENFAREYWGTPAGALGRRIRISATDDWREIVGVVGDVHDDGLDKPARTNVYWPVLLARFRGQPLRADRYVTFVVRSPLAGSGSFMHQVRQAVWSVDAKLPPAGFNTLDFFYARSLARTSFTLVMLGIAGAMALLLGAIGLYGVIAYSVSQRTREIGIRMALGALPQDVLRPIVGGGMAVVSVGLSIGIVAALAFSRLLSSMLFGVRPEDPLTYSAVVFLLGAVALIACYIPARRATRVHPVVALRCE
ncbi:MAG: ADOP family duplicated permease [Betaproteobacteria bacterium]